MFDTFLNSGGIDVLERTLQFAGRRHELIVHNIANLSTPNYRPIDVDAKSFQAHLADAVSQRRESTGHGRHAPLELRDTDQVEFRRGGVQLNPKPVGDGIIFHDRNDRDLERTMQSLAENVMVYRQAAELVQARMRTLQMVIRERA